jgi:glycosyltransferase involved in cell wall biosynthesis
MNKFNYVGPINTTGYGVASVSYLNSLTKQNNNISIYPIGQIANPEIATTTQNCLAKEVYADRPTFCFWHLSDIPNQLSKFTGKKVAYTTFEVDTLRPEEAQLLPLFDKVGTASEWGASILKKYILEDKIFVVNHAMKSDSNSTLATINIDRKANLKVWEKLMSPVKLTDDTLILSTAGKFESRKGHPELIEACMESQIPILLIAYVYNPFITGSFPYSFINSKFLYPVYTTTGVKVYSHKNFKLVLMPPAASRLELHNALSKADYFISPSKAEGWNLPLFEMMSYGMPCITTNYSAHTEYVTKDNVIVVEHEGLEKAIDNQFFHGTGNWAKVTKETIAKAINTAYSNMNNKIYLSKLSKAAIRATEHFSWTTESKKIQKLMDNL